MSPFQAPTDDQIKHVLDEAQTIAVVGASSKKDRPSYGVMKRLIAQGYHVIPVNPNETEILGQEAFPSLQSVPASIDIVDVFRRSEATPAIADEAVKVGAKALWLQLGVYNEDAAKKAEEGGLEVVMDECIAVKLSRLGVPKK